ncbi:MAG: glycoside hydrolase family 3 protein [Bacteroidales bacterium]|nr:glycoside hydrolase family 3 protein [Bacteroidales bacterium]
MAVFFKRDILILSIIISVSLFSCGKDDKTEIIEKPDTTAVVTYPYQDSTLAVVDRVSDLMSRMTLKQKIGQMIQADSYPLLESELSSGYLGSVLSGGGSNPESNIASSWASMVNDFQKIAMKNRIPLVYGIDAIHGHNNVSNAVIFPHNIGLGCIQDMQTIEDAARVTAIEMSATGIPWTFAPCVAVARNIRWGRTYESYSENPDVVAKCGAAAVRGLQGSSLNNTTSVIACAKHFIGDGGTTEGDDQGNTELTEEELRAIHLPGYIAAIEEGVATIMVSYSSFNNEKMHANQYLITDVLKNELRFSGFVISDWDGVKDINSAGGLKQSITLAINAGIDMMMVPFDYINHLQYLEELVNDGSIKMDRINDAVSRILKVKFQKGLFERPYANAALSNEIGTNAHRDVARKCVQQSIVLLKNENKILPLSKSASKILVAGSIADDLGAQCGGWTIDWQGTNGDITTGTTILEGIKNGVNNASNVIYSSSGANASGSAVAIVVVGEKTPYAEGKGDKMANELVLSDDDITTINNVSATGVPIVLLIVSGRPLVIDEAILAKCSALCAVWLPGSEGAGVADVLFGDYNPTAKLCRMWPRNVSQVEKNSNTELDPLYPLGFGLNY